MNFVRQIKNVFVPLNATSISEVDLQPGDIVHTYKDGKHYGSCGCVLATQVETSRQIRYERPALERPHS